MLALTLGSLRTFDVISTLEATEFTKATGKLRFIGAHIGIFVDTSAFPSYTDADLARIGNLFDTDLYPTVVASFGPESDIDRNGKVLVLMTPRVNALVAANDCGQHGFVTGFFYGRDLLPSLPHRMPARSSTRSSPIRSRTTAAPTPPTTRNGWCRGRSFTRCST